MAYEEKINIFVDKWTNLKLDLLALESNCYKSELLRNSINNLIVDMDHNLTVSLCNKWINKQRVNPFVVKEIKKYLKV